MPSDPTGQPQPEQTIYTEYGPLTAPMSLLRTWDRYGWPDEPVLQQMVTDQRVARIAQNAGATDTTGPGAS